MRPFLPAIAGLVLFAAFGAASAAEGYLRLGIGTGWARDAHLADVDCAQATPPALFGCVEGSDGRPIGAYGNFGRGVVGEVGLGQRFSPRWRGELLVASHGDLAFEGEANFTGVQGAQPVHAGARSLAAFAAGFADFREGADWQPYLGLGIGVARNRLDPVSYGFPGLAPGALTRTRGGADTGFAWMAAAGVTVALGPRASLDLGLRHADLGEVRSEPGAATIVRASGERTIEVGGTRARLRTTGVVAGLRWTF